MDNVSHTLVGAAIGEAGLKRYTGLAMVTLMVAANLPDLDVLSIPFGNSITFRRGWTHGPLAILILPAALTALVVGFDRWQARRGTRPPKRGEVRPRAIFLLSLAGFLTHPALDWLNNYGIRLLMPFSHEWYYGDAVFIVDPWLWIALGTGVWMARRRARRETLHRRRPAVVAIVVSTIYIALMIAGSRVAVRAAVSEASANGLAEVDRVVAGPVALNPLRRDLIYDVGSAYYLGTLRWAPDLRIVVERDPMPKNAAHPAVMRAAETEPIRDYLYWSRFPLFEVREDAGGFHVRATDARYARRSVHWLSAEVYVRHEDPGGASVDSPRGQR